RWHHLPGGKALWHDRLLNITLCALEGLRLLFTDGMLLGVTMWECYPGVRREHCPMAWTRGPSGPLVPPGIPETQGVLGSQPGTMLCLVRSIVLTGMLRRRCGAKQACVTATWHDTCT